MITNKNYYQAFLSRDRRFDGEFFTGVRTTGIYCRPVCKVRTPKERNCIFFKTAAEAEYRGFRPCLRCRPEIAPGNAIVDHEAEAAYKAAKMIDQGFLDEHSIADLAGVIHITDRHLRRIFQEQWKVSPVAYLQTKRLLLAKQLLTETSLPITDLAYAAGFESISRFNTAFKKNYELTPRQLRKSGLKKDKIVSLAIGYRPPFNWEALLTFLCGRAILGVESVDSKSYKRTISINKNNKIYEGWVKVTNDPEKAQLLVTIPVALVPVIAAILSRIKNLFDTEAHPDIISESLGKIAKDSPGLRVPGCFDGFELSVRAVIGQQITVKAATRIAGRLAKTLGKHISTPYGELQFLFPSVTAINQIELIDIIKCGIYSKRAETIKQLANANLNGLVLNSQGNVEDTLSRLRAISGIGEWTAQYIAMRALSWPDAFPHTDYAVKKVLVEKNAKLLLMKSKQWQPWRAYATMHIWHSLNKKGGEQ
jgi:AraC family transcriptional regulator of adaptative response / DNA-3-methyladenine glycosylase II